MSQNKGMKVRNRDYIGKESCEYWAVTDSTSRAYVRRTAFDTIEVGDKFAKVTGDPPRWAGGFRHRE